MAGKWRVILPCIGAFALVLIPGTIAAFGLTAIDTTTPLGFVVMLLVTFGAIGVGVAGWMKIRRQSGWARWFPVARWGEYGPALAFGLVLFGIVLSIARLIVTVNAVWIGSLLAIVSLIGWAVQSAVEEIVTRGWLMDRVAKYGKTTALWASSTTFTAMHAFNPDVSYLALANIFLFAVLMALIVQRTGNLWRVAGIHAGWNFAQGSLFTMPVSGLATGAGVFSLHISGAQWLTGGGFGLEASIITTVVLLITIFAQTGGLK